MSNKIMQAIGRRRIHASISYNTPLNNGNKTSVWQESKWFQIANQKLMGLFDNYEQCLYVMWVK